MKLPTTQTFLTAGKRLIFFFVIAITVLVSLQSSGGQVHALNADELFEENFNTGHVDPTFCSGNTDNTANANGKVIVIDPGHNAANHSDVDQKTGLRDHDYPNDYETDEVFYVSLKVKDQLKKDGYTVILTKGDDIPTDVKSVKDAGVKKGAAIDLGKFGLQARAKVANDANAALAVSIHDDHGQSWSNFGQVYVQRPDLYRIGANGKKTFTDIIGSSSQAATVSNASQKAGDDMSKARIAAEGRSVKSLVTNADFNNRGPTIDPGNLPMVMMFSKVPWVYNEVGAAPKNQYLSQAHLDAYAQGIIKGVEAYVPSGGTSTATTGTPTSGTPASGTTITMQQVDTTGFAPAKQALSSFKSSDLPRLKKFIPLYVKAAQAEGVPQNWEILPGLQGPESDFADTWIPNYLGYTGPFQEGPSELAPYLKDPQYKDALSQLITPGGGLKKVGKLSDDQFVVLARLVFKIWVRQGTKDNYKNVLEKGPVPFTNNADNSNIFQQIMNRYNSGVKYEGFNGFHPPQYPWGMNGFQHSGLATTYYMLKDWERNGGMSTISVPGGGSGSGNCSAASSSNTTTGTVGATCDSSVTGRARILSCAKVYDPISYEESARGGHSGAVVWHKTVCPKIPGKPWPYASCVLDCSGLVSIAVYDAFGYDHPWNTASLRADNANWHDVSVNDLAPGDLIEPFSGHVEIVDHVTKDRIYTFGSHSAKYPQPRQVSPASFPITEHYALLRYYGPGVK